MISMVRNMCTVHVHYTPDHLGSVWAGNRSKNSFEKHGWNVKLVEGHTPSTVEFNHMLLPEGRTQFIINNNPERTLVKLSILSNHLRFWEMVSKGTEPMIYAEHETICVENKFDLPEFEDVLALHIDNKNNQYQSMHVNLNEDYFHYYLKEGIHDLPPDYPYEYTYPTKYEGAKIMVGASCYALTPQGATKLLTEVEEHGAEQGDMLINTKAVNIKYKTPALVSMFHPISQSHPINKKVTWDDE